ncbi:unnamed protein product [Amaranthus hypochondriacus]
MKNLSSISVVLMVFCYGFLCNADLLEDDMRALLDFVNKVPHLHALDWSISSPICSNWTGITCNAD